MKLLKEVDTNGKYPRRYLLLQDVTEEDSKILELCNMVRVMEFDGSDAEAWMVM